MIEQEVRDQDKARAVAQAAANAAFQTLLAAAQTSFAASAVTCAADGSAAGGTKTAIAASAVLVAALDASSVYKLCCY